MAKLYIGNTAYKVMLGNNRGHIADLPTVVWNQLVPIPGSNISVTKNGVTFTDNRDGSYTIQTIPEGSTARVSIWFGTVGVGNSKKYVSKGGVVPILLGWGGNGNYVYNNEKSNIITVTTGSFGFVIPTGTIIASPVTFNPIIIDLTLMFGAGNEPTTVAQFEQWFTDNIGTLDNYYPYNEGEEIKVKYLP